MVSAKARKKNPTVPILLQKQSTFAAVDLPNWLPRIRHATALPSLAATAKIPNEIRVSEISTRSWSTSGSKICKSPDQQNAEGGARSKDRIEDRLFH